MSNRDAVLDLLRSVAPQDLTNQEIGARTGVRPHQQVFMITRDLMQAGLIKGLQSGHECRFWFDPAATRDPALRQARRPQQSGAADGPHDWDAREAIECRLGMTWQPLGRIVLLPDGRLHFPAAPPAPAICRFRIRRGNTESRTVGETENLQRRLTLYRTPGPSQATNLLVNATFRETLRDGAEIAVSAVIVEAWIERAGEKTVADLSSKAVRCLFENAALLETGGATVESLNR